MNAPNDRISSVESTDVANEPSTSEGHASNRQSLQTGISTPETGMTPLEPGVVTSETAPDAAASRKRDEVLKKLKQENRWSDEEGDEMEDDEDDDEIIPLDFHIKVEEFYRDILHESYKSDARDADVVIEACRPNVTSEVIRLDEPPVGPLQNFAAAATDHPDVIITNHNTVSSNLPSSLQTTIQSYVIPSSNSLAAPSQALPAAFPVYSTVPSTFANPAQPGQVVVVNWTDLKAVKSELRGVQDPNDPDMPPYDDVQFISASTVFDPTLVPQPPPLPPPPPVSSALSAALTTSSMTTVTTSTKYVEKESQTDLMGYATANHQMPVAVKQIERMSFPINPRRSWGKKNPVVVDLPPSVEEDDSNSVCEVLQSNVFLVGQGREEKAFVQTLPTTDGGKFASIAAFDESGAAAVTSSANPECVIVDSNCASPETRDDDDEEDAGAESDGAGDVIVEDDSSSRRTLQSPSRGLEPISKTNKKYSYKCRYCDKVYTHAASRKVHERKHTGEEPYQCPACRRSFPYSSHLKQHAKKCGAVLQVDEPPTLVCSACGQKFRHQKSLSTHYRFKHDRPRMECPDCGWAFPALSYLKRHRLKCQAKTGGATGSDEKGSSTAVSSKSPKDPIGDGPKRRTRTERKLYYCFRCGWNSRKKKSLDAHLRQCRGDPWAGEEPKREEEEKTVIFVDEDDGEEEDEEDEEDEIVEKTKKAGEGGSNVVSSETRPLVEEKPLVIDLSNAKWIS